MKLIAVIGTTALLAAAPASIGLIGNTSFSEDVPVRVPATATLLDSQGSPTASPSHRSHPRGDAEPGDDHGGDRPSGTRGEAEPGDDHGEAESGDDHGGHGGHGGDDSGGDDSGGDRHGGDGSDDD